LFSIFIKIFTEHRTEFRLYDVLYFDFYLGGRKLGPIVTAMSTEASDMSGWLLMGLPGVAYFTGLADATWTAIGLAVGTYLNWLFVAKRLRQYSFRIDAITIPDFFAKRYRDPKLIEGIAAIVVIVFFIPYTASGFAACGKLFTNLFNISYMTAMLIRRLRHRGLLRHGRLYGGLRHQPLCRASL
jgi:sodium/proline symporter